MKSGRSRKILTIPKQWIRCLAFHPDGNTLAVASDSSIMGYGSVGIWDVKSGGIKATISGVESICLKFSRDGETLMSSSGKEVHFLDPENGVEIKKIELPKAPAVRGAAFSPDGKSLATGSYRNRVSVWNLDTGRVNGTLAGQSEPVTAVAYSPDGETLQVARLTKPFDCGIRPTNCPTSTPIWKKDGAVSIRSPWN